MTKYVCLTFLLVSAFISVQAQDSLPSITVKNVNNKIIVSWVNNYTKPIANLNIQRSYDSLKNYSTIGSVLSPQSRENGYADANPPFNKMYYRVFVAFEGGSYIITPPMRPVKDLTAGTTKDSALFYFPGKPGVLNQSLRVFTSKENNVVIYLPDVLLKKYSVKFYNDTEKMIFELTNLKDEYLIIEKVNFGHTGNFRFEIFEDGKLSEQNTFQILKDSKKL